MQSLHSIANDGEVRTVDRMRRYHALNVELNGKRTHEIFEFFKTCCDQSKMNQFIITATLLTSPTILLYLYRFYISSSLDLTFPRLLWSHRRKSLGLSSSHWLSIKWLIQCFLIHFPPEQPIPDVCFLQELLYQDLSKFLSILVFLFKNSFFVYFTKNSSEDLVLGSCEVLITIHCHQTRIHVRLTDERQFYKILFLFFTDKIILFKSFVRPSNIYLVKRSYICYFFLINPIIHYYSKVLEI